MPFVPTSDSRTTRLLDHVRTNMPSAGNMLPYEVALEIIDVAYDGAPSDVLSSIVAKVNQRLHREGDWRLLVCVPLQGYRVATPEEVRQEVLAINRQAARKHVRSQRAIETVIRHPDASVAERRRAADASALNAALLRLVRREQSKIRRAWPRDETSPVPAPKPLGDDIYGDDID